MTRCEWADTSPEMQRYHDQEWGRPVHDDRHHFELLVLEGAQAGLSWATILRKREAYSDALCGFDANALAAWDDVDRLMQNPGLVRNRLKLQSVPLNARCFLEVQRESGSFDRFVWNFVGGRPQRNNWRTMSEVPAQTAASDALSKALRKRGFKFVGSTICYAYMQAAGLVNDHLVSCSFR
ncbi:MAG: DNA-3-methyladenine glycosylase I [Candidatus Xenobia bacterium]